MSGHAHPHSHLSEINGTYLLPGESGVAALPTICPSHLGKQVAQGSGADICLPAYLPTHSLAYPPARSFLALHSWQVGWAGSPTTSPFQGEGRGGEEAGE